MRAIQKPSAPSIDSGSMDDYASALGNAVGRYCSFCEKALNYRLGLFHKQDGVLKQNAKLTSGDWNDLLLICGDCAASAASFDPNAGFFWPDTPDAAQSPFLYDQRSGVAMTVLDPDGSTYLQTSTDMVLVSLSTDVSADIQAGAQKTYALFKLNGKYFNDDFSNPEYTIPFSAYIRMTDARLDMRNCAYLRAVEAGQALARAIPTTAIAPSYLGNAVAMTYNTIEGFGFQSTWWAGITATLNGAGPDLLPQLLAFMTGQAPTTPPNRKRTAEAMSSGVPETRDLSFQKRMKGSAAVNQILSVKS